VGLSGVACSLRDSLTGADFRMRGTARCYLGALPDRLLLCEAGCFFRSLMGSISGGAFSNHLSRGRDGFCPVFRSSSRSRPST
jgi:hypothetical protein